MPETTAIYDVDGSEKNMLNNKKNKNKKDITI